MKFQRLFSCITGAFFALGLAASQAGAGADPAVCDFEIEINALRAQAPTVRLGETRNVTAKARITKGTALVGTTIDVLLQIDALDGTTRIWSVTSGLIRLGVGKGGKGAKLPMFISRCVTGKIVFEARFFGDDDDGDLCEATRRITKICN